jgi:CheY-like chemotaxis protein
LIASVSSILLVDDEAAALDLGKRLLKRLGFKAIDVAASGVAAFQMAQEKTYSVIISDWNMPEMTGIELLWRVRQDPSLALVPFLMTSVDGDLSRVTLARELGVDAFLLKPYDRDALRAKLLEVTPHLPELTSNSASALVSKLPKTFLQTSRS